MKTLNSVKSNVAVYTAKIITLCVGVTFASMGLSANQNALQAAELKVGDVVPAFEVTDDSGSIWKSTDHVGKKVLVVYFYPADMTGGCTKQACGFRDDSAKLTKLGAEVVGVSGDSASNHQLFKKEKKLNFTLLADTEGKIAELFGVPVTRGAKSIKVEIDGKEEMLSRNVSTSRWTFIIGLDGKLVSKNTSVVAADDSRAAIEAISALKTPK
jgi:peroxiredoxin Q/BCP